MKRALVFGGSGQIGEAVVGRLLAGGWDVTALSRQPRRDAPGLKWLQGEFATLPEMPAECEAVLSCGPLDLFSSWYANARIQAARIVAFGSTSVQTKHASSDTAERELAQRLREAETRVFAASKARAVPAVVLRPTLVYGSGRDASLSRVAAMAVRRGCFVLPRGAHGLRQPVHVDDLAQAVWQALESAEAPEGAYALPGGETLPYRDMIARTLAALPGTPRLLELPAPLFRLALMAARITGRLQGLPGGAVDRMREDLVFDPDPARRDLGYAPRDFRPTAAMLLPGLIRNREGFIRRM